MRVESQVRSTVQCTVQQGKKKTVENKDCMKDSSLANTVTSHQIGTAFELLVGTFVGV